MCGKGKPLQDLCCDQNRVQRLCDLREVSLYEKGFSQY